MLVKNKKGVSEIVVTIIIILLAIVVFAIVSVVVRGTVTKGAENIELSANCLEIEMHAVKIVNGTMSSGKPIFYNVTVSRSSSGKEVDGVKLIIEDIANSKSASSSDLIGKIKPLDKVHRTINYDGFIPTQVTVVPFFMKKSGEIYYCENTQIDKIAVFR